MISFKLLSVAILLGGMMDCTTVQSRHPLADEHNTVFEPGLVGEWADANSDTENIPLMIQRNGDSSYAITVRTKEGSAPMESYIFNASAVRLGGQLFLDAQFRAVRVGDHEVSLSDLTVPAHWIARVQLKQDTLVLEFLDGDRVSDVPANRDGKLQSDTADGTMLLTSPTSDLQKFIEANANDEWLFNLQTDPLQRVVKQAPVP